MSMHIKERNILLKLTLLLVTKLEHGQFQWKLKSFKSFKYATEILCYYKYESTVKYNFISASVPRTAAFELHMVVRYLLRPNSVSTYPFL
jgi:hypothetical protein